ncbi:MAG: PmoA family protein [Phycisphaerae bacterium]|nr:PmoA family protein [Phycisphaerae bacterium]
MHRITGRVNLRGWTYVVVLAMAAVLIAEVANAEKKAETKFEWKKTDTSLALLNNGSVVWEYHHDKEPGKPYMKVCLTDGTELTRPWPKPDGYKGYDHLWHKAMWWSWKFINGINFWESNPKGTVPVKVDVTAGKDSSARIALDINYQLPKQEPLLKEKRLIAISTPGADGRYTIDWTATFTAGKKDVTLNKNWYGGMAIRMAKRTSKWTFRDSEGRTGEKGCSRKRSKWVDFSGALKGDRKAGLAVFVHRDNPRQPPPWCVIQGMPYFNPVFTGAEDYKLAAGKSLTLRYRILVHPGIMTRRQVESEWKVFCGSAGGSKVKPTPAPAPAKPGSLAFVSSGKEQYSFDTGVLRGTLRQGGKSRGLSGFTHIPSKTRLNGGLGIFGHYRVFTTNKRYGPAAWGWASTSKLTSDGAVEVRWPKAKDRPFEMMAVYRWSAPDTLDLTTTVKAAADLSKFESFIASYFTKSLPASSIYVKGDSKTGGKPIFQTTEKSAGHWQMFPRSKKVVPMIKDGRWKQKPHPVDWAIRDNLAAPLGMRRGKGDAPTAILMAPAADCYALSTPFAGEGHRSFYLSLFGRDIKAGQTATARCRLVIAKSPTDQQIVELYKKYTTQLSKVTKDAK